MSSGHSKSKVLVLTSKGMSATDIVETTTTIQEAFDAEGIEAVVSNSFDDFTKNSENDGGWGGWMKAVVGRYDVFVLPSNVLGKGNRNVVENILTEGKAVIYVTPKGEFFSVIGTTEIDAKNWHTGWRAVIDRES